MANKLSDNFFCDRYGIHCRLANENDSEFILSLRTNERLSKYMHYTDNDIELQRNWMRAYEERRNLGIDYYFIYFFNNIPFAVNRIYDIENNHGTGGSWICAPGTLPEVSMASLILMRDFLFEDLGLEYDLFDVQEGNKQVRKIHLMLGAKMLGVTGNQENFSLYKDDYFDKRPFFLELLNLSR